LGRSRDQAGKRNGFHFKLSIGLCATKFVRLNL
jgi:hypothetical protein